MTRAQKPAVIQICIYIIYMHYLPASAKIFNDPQTFPRLFRVVFQKLMYNYFTLSGLYQYFADPPAMADASCIRIQALMLCRVKAKFHFLVSDEIGKMSTTFQKSFRDVQNRFGYNRKIHLFVLAHQIMSNFEQIRGFIKKSAV